MFYVLQNESTAALRRVPILLTDAATGTTAQTGVASTQIFPYVNINGGAFAGGAGTVGEAGYGQYYYEMDPSEISTLGLAGIHITAAGCRDYDAIAQIAAFNVYSAAGNGISAYDVWNYVLSDNNTADTDLTSITSTVNSIDTATTNIYADTQAINTNTQPAAIAASVWGEDLGTMGYAAGTAGTILYDLSLGGAGITAGDVWDFVITGFGQTGSAAEYVTQTNFTVGNIEVYVANQTPNDIWNYAGIEGRTITGGTATTVTNVTNPVLVDTSSMTGIAGTVWNYGTRTLTSGGSGISAADVWSYATRTITGGTVDTNNDKTGYSLSGTQSFNLTGNITGSLSGSVGSVSGNVGGNVAGSVASVNLLNANSIAANSFQSGAIDATALATDAVNEISAGVWGYATRTITGGTVATVTNPVSLATASMTGIAGTVWNSLTSAYTTHGTYGYNILRSDLDSKEGDVTLYSAGGVNGVDADVHRIANDTAAATALKDILTGIGSSITANITGNITGNLSGSVGSVTSPVSVATASMTGIAGTVWNYGTRTLTSGGGAGISAYDVWNYVLSDTNTAETDLVQAAAGSGLTAGDVWTYATRTITGGTVDTVTNGVTVTTNNDKSGYSLSGTQSFNLTGNITGNLSGSVGSVSAGVTVTTNNDKTGYELSPAGVSAVQSGLSTLTQAQVGTEVDSSLADVGLTTTVTGRIDATVSSRLASASYTAPPTTSAIAGTVWTYGTRTLTSGSGISAGDVWSYNISAITTSGSAGKQLNDAAVSGSVVTIVNGPYKLTSTAEGTDGRIDILQGSVQTINLNLVNGFGQPFNVTGYTLSVDIYDVSSTLVEQYTPTVNYDEGGNISFDIDTVVTNVIGTYSLVVSLTNGDVVQVGPLTILVRPL